jgi:hypothetical protein
MKCHEGNLEKFVSHVDGSEEGFRCFLFPDIDADFAMSTPD